MTLLATRKFPDHKFDLYFLGFDSDKAASPGDILCDRQGLIELTHNYGTEHDARYRPSNGNEPPHLGFSHTCISVDNVDAACRRLKLAGHQFRSAPDAPAGLSNPVILFDPDRYWIQLVQQHPDGQKRSDGQKHLSGQKQPDGQKHPDGQQPDGTHETDVKTYRMVRRCPQHVPELSILCQ